MIIFIPIKENSQRVPRKNFREINGVPLYKHTLYKLSDYEVYVDTDSNEIIDYCENNNIKTIERIPELLKDSASGNDLLNHWVNLKPNYDIYYHMHITNPFMTKESIQDCVDILISNEKYDSIFSAIEEKHWYWFDNKPVNYDPLNFGRSQDEKGVIRETVSLYGIRREAFLKRKSKIGENPFMYNVSQIEALDIDTEFDWIIAERVYKYLNSKK